MQPFVSVVLFVRNVRNTVDRAIRSVVESGANVELLVLDGGSTDGTQDVVERYRKQIAFWRSRSDRGPSEAINEGVAQARGGIICLLSGDDWFEIGALEKVQEAFMEDNALEVLSGGVRICSESTGEHIVGRATFTDSTMLEFKPANIVRYPLTHGKYIRKSIYERLGGYSEVYRISNDLDFLLRVCALAPKITTLPVVTYNYLAHSGSLTVGGDERWILVAAEDNLRIAEAHLQRKELRIGDRNALLGLHGRAAARLAWSQFKHGRAGDTFHILSRALRQNPFWPTAIPIWLLRAQWDRMRGRRINAQEAKKREDS